jgi:hypothetical protein
LGYRPPAPEAIMPGNSAWAALYVVSFIGTHRPDC